MKFRNSLASLTSILAILGIGYVSTVLAVPPEKGEEVFDIVEWEIGDCDGFKVMVDTHVTFKYFDHFDKAGDWTFSNLQFFSDNTIYYNSTQPSLNLIGSPSESEIHRLSWDGDAIMGVPFKVVVPGLGMIFHEGGRIVFDVYTGEMTFEAGPKDFSEGNLAALCAALTS